MKTSPGERESQRRAIIRWPSKRPASFSAGHFALRQFEGQALASQGSQWEDLLSCLFDVLQGGVIVRWTVMGEDQSPDPSRLCHANCHVPGAVPPALPGGRIVQILFFGVLRVVDQHVGPVGELDEPLVSSFLALGVGSDDQATAQPLNAINEHSTGMSVTAHDLDLDDTLRGIRVVKVSSDDLGLLLVGR